MSAACLAAASCAPSEPHRPSPPGHMETSFTANLSRAENGDREAMAALVEYYNAEGPYSDLEYWRHRMVESQPPPD